MANEAQIPEHSPWLLRGFTKYVRRMLRKNFHVIRIAGGDQLSDFEGRPLVVFCNHPSWWDPLTCLFLQQHFLSHRPSYAPIDARALERYGFFRKLGFFGVEQNSLNGARVFLRTASAILAEPRCSLWLTPEGEMTDPRKRPITLQPGLGHLAKRVPETVFIPLAIEYPFHMERQPELLAKFGKPLPVSELPSDPDAITQALAEGLEATLDAVAEAAVQRDWDAFTVAQSGSATTDMFYDLWLRFKARLTGKTYENEHASILRS